MVHLSGKYYYTLHNGYPNLNSFSRGSLGIDIYKQWYPEGSSKIDISEKGNYFRGSKIQHF